MRVGYILTESQMSAKPKIMPALRGVARSRRPRLATLLELYEDESSAVASCENRGYGKPA